MYSYVWAMIVEAFQPALSVIISFVVTCQLWHILGLVTGPDVYVYVYICMFVFNYNLCKSKFL